MVVMVVVPLPLALALHHTWPGQGLRLEGSLGMLLVRSRIPSPRMWSWMVLIFPCLGKCCFMPHFLNSSADPNRA